MKDLTNRNIIHRKSNGFEYIQFRKLLEYPEIKHLFTLKPLDFGTHATYESKKNLACFAESFVKKELEIDFLCRSIQTHKDVVRYVSLENQGIFNEELNDVDGLITDVSNMGLLQTYADCTPLLFYDPVRKIIANTHSGWKGTYQRIGYKTVEKLKDKFGCDPKDIICCIGPHIRKCSFEVDKDVADMFYDEFSDMSDINELITYDQIKNKYFIDTAAININLMLKAGLMIENIIDSGICTVCNSDICQSFRADKAESGRAAAVIALA